MLTPLKYTQKAMILFPNFEIFFRKIWLVVFRLQQSLLHLIFELLPLKAKMF